MSTAPSAPVVPPIAPRAPPDPEVEASAPPLPVVLAPPEPPAPAADFDPTLPHPSTRHTDKHAAMSCNCLKPPSIDALTLSARTASPSGAEPKGDTRRSQNARRRRGVAALPVLHTVQRFRLSRQQSRWCRRSGAASPPLASNAEGARLLEALRVGWRDWFGLFAFLLLTGARRGEAAGLRWDDLDLSRRLVTIRRSYHSPPKSGRARTSHRVREADTRLLLGIAQIESGLPVRERVPPVTPIGLESTAKRNTRTA